MVYVVEARAGEGLLGILGSKVWFFFMLAFAQRFLGLLVVIGFALVRS